MSSGVNFNENYGNPKADIHRMSAVVDTGSVNEYLTTLKRHKETGKHHKYKSCDTQVLAWVLLNTIGKSLTELTQLYIWEPLGMEGDWAMDINFG